jgi:hypothetical protein
VVASWFYTQSADEGGLYAQVSGDSASESFRDVYRRCIGVFYATARRADPGAQLALVLNRPWDRKASSVADRVGDLLDALGVRVLVRPYTYAPPSSWTASWRNQFFVFDALHALTSAYPGAMTALLDSDVVWSGQQGMAQMWSALEESGCLTYELEYPPDSPINGLSRAGLTALGRELGLLRDAGTVGYSGGEFVALDAKAAQLVMEGAASLWPRVLEMHRQNDLVCEEAHLLSLLYRAQGLATGGGNAFIKRIWTQPFKYRNVDESDLSLAAWHVPAEKRYGLRRLYGRIDERGELFAGLDEPAWRANVAATIGIPGNSMGKAGLDVGSAMLGRARRLLTRA